ncbi:MAG: hypothetical protein QM764_22345 [Chitinophagaceae bacterium]
MFHLISWHTYGIAVFISVILYYTIIVVLYYRKDIPRWVARLRKREPLTVANRSDADTTTEAS